MHIFSPAVATAVWLDDLHSLTLTHTLSQPEQLAGDE